MKARIAGVNVPYILFIDFKKRKIYMEHIISQSVNEYLVSNKEAAFDSQIGNVYIPH